MDSRDLRFIEGIKCIHQTLGRKEVKTRLQGLQWAFSALRYVPIIESRKLLDVDIQRNIRLLRDQFNETLRENEELITTNTNLKIQVNRFKGDHAHIRSMYLAQGLGASLLDKFASKRTHSTVQSAFLAIRRFQIDNLPERQRAKLAVLDAVSRLADKLVKNSPSSKIDRVSTPDFKDALHLSSPRRAATPIRPSTASFGMPPLEQSPSQLDLTVHSKEGSMRSLRRPSASSAINERPPTPPPAHEVPIVMLLEGADTLRARELQARGRGGLSTPPPVDPLTGAVHAARRQSNSGRDALKAIFRSQGVGGRDALSDSLSSSSSSSSRDGSVRSSEGASSVGDAERFQQRVRKAGGENLMSGENLSEAAPLTGASERGRRASLVERAESSSRSGSRLALRRLSQGGSRRGSNLGQIAPSSRVLESVILDGPFRPPLEDSTFSRGSRGAAEEDRVAALLGGGESEARPSTVVRVPPGIAFNVVMERDGEVWSSPQYCRRPPRPASPPSPPPSIKVVDAPLMTDTSAFHFAQTAASFLQTGGGWQGETFDSNSGGRTFSRTPERPSPETAPPFSLSPLLLSRCSPSPLKAKPVTLEKRGNLETPNRLADFESTAGFPRSVLRSGGSRVSSQSGGRQAARLLSPPPPEGSLNSPLRTLEDRLNKVFGCSLGEPLKGASFSSSRGSSTSSDVLLSALRGTTESGKQEESLTEERIKLQLREQDAKLSGDLKSKLGQLRNRGEVPSLTSPRPFRAEPASSSASSASSLGALPAPPLSARSGATTSWLTD